MNNDQNYLLARLSAHEFLLEQLFAMLLMQSNDPLESARQMSADSSRSGLNVRVPTSTDGKTIEALANEMRHSLSLFWERVQARVTEGLKERGQTPL